MKLTEGVFEHVLSPYVDCQVVSSNSFVKTLELLSKESAFDIKVEYTSVVHEDCERSVSEVHGGLAKDLVQHGTVLLCKQ